MTTASYTPRQGSLASAVLAWFRENPEEELSSRDVATKFGVDVKKVVPGLRTIVDYELLFAEKRASDSGSTSALHYSLAPAGWDRPTTSAPAANDAAAAPGIHFHSDGLAMFSRSDLVCMSAGGRCIELSQAQAALAAKVLPVLLSQTPTTHNS